MHGLNLEQLKQRDGVSNAILNGRKQIVTVSSTLESCQRIESDINAIQSTAIT